jgi:hypothetical protein
MRVPLALLASAAVAVAASLIAPAADAGSRRWLPHEPKVGFVTAESRYSTQTITAPVRVNAQGRPEVRLPGGTWIECRRSCSNTLRQETVDFWYIRSDPNTAGDDGPGYLTYHFDW